MTRKFFLTTLLACPLLLVGCSKPKEKGCVCHSTPDSVVDSACLCKDGSKCCDSCPCVDCTSCTK